MCGSTWTGLCFCIEFLLNTCCHQYIVKNSVICLTVERYINCLLFLCLLQIFFAIKVKAESTAVPLKSLYVSIQCKQNFQLYHSAILYWGVTTHIAFISSWPNFYVLFNTVENMYFYPYHECSVNVFCVLLMYYNFVPFVGNNLLARPNVTYDTVLETCIINNLLQSVWNKW